MEIIFVLVAVAIGAMYGLKRINDRDKKRIEDEEEARRQTRYELQQKMMAARVHGRAPTTSWKPPVQYQQERRRADRRDTFRPENIDHSPGWGPGDALLGLTVANSLMSSSHAGTGASTTSDTFRSGNGGDFAGAGASSSWNDKSSCYDTTPAPAPSPVYESPSPSPSYDSCSSSSYSSSSDYSSSSSDSSSSYSSSD